MKIYEIIVESPEDIKLLISLSGFDLDQIKHNSQKVKNQFLKDPDNPVFVFGMKQFLSQLNIQLLGITQLSQWSEWIETTDGKEVQKEILDLYDENLNFIRDFSKK
jgi:hypothetical protein